MESLASSKVKTEHSFVDNISVNDAGPSVDYSNKVEETTKIVNWAKKMLSNGVHFHAPQKHQSSVNSFFIIKIESLHSLPFRRVSLKSKVYVLITAILINTKTGKQYFKATKTSRQLQELNPYLFDLKESIYYYCYTPNEADVIVQIQVAISELLHSAEQREPIFMNYECVGYLSLELSKERKSKQKSEITLPGVLNRFHKQSHEKNSAYAYVFVVKSESFKCLEKLVLQNTICDSSDRIPGVLGYFLPNNENSLTDFSLTTQAKALVINTHEIAINQSIFKDSYVKCERIMSQKYKESKRLQCFCNELRLKVSFHNSWRNVSDCEVQLKEKQNMQGALKTHQSIISGMQVNKSKENISFSKQKEKEKQKKDTKIQAHYKYFTVGKPLELDLIFPDEEECVLILQIYAHFTVNVEYEQVQSKPPFQQFKEEFDLPICFGLLSAKNMTKLRFQTLRLNEGCPLTSVQQLKTMVNNEIKRLQQPSTQPTQAQQPQAKRASRQSAIRIDVQTLSAVKSVRTISNLTQKTFKDPLVQLGRAEFQIQVIQKEPGAIISNRSFGIENISGLNLSRVEAKDKIAAEKERIAKQAKKAVQTTKKMQIQFYRIPKVPDNFKYEVAASITKQVTSKKQYQKQNLLSLLKKSIPSLKLPLKMPKLKTEKQQQAMLNNFANPAYYRLKLAHALQLANYQSVKLPAEFYYLQSNYHYNQNLSCYLYEKTPIQTIKTQLAQIMYNNCFFFNFEHLTSASAQSPTKLPQIFFLKTQFWNESPIRSQLLTVNKDTGEITLFGFDELPEVLKKQLSKIMHVQISMDQSIDNYQMNFIHFIDYLYNGLLKIEIIDYTTAHHYGSFYAPLRNLIRKRRNEAIVVHQDYIYHKNAKKGKMRLEMRAIRKIRHQSKGQQKLRKEEMDSKKGQNLEQKGGQAVKIQGSAVIQQRELEQKRQKQRILKFKQVKSKVNQRKPTLEQQQQTNYQQQLKQLKHIENIVVDKYMVQKKVLKVNFLTRHYFFVNISNNTSRNTLYQLIVNDEDAQHVVKNPLSGGEELVVVKNISFLQPEDLEKISAIKKNATLIPKCKPLNQEGLIFMQANEKATLLLCYLSVRKFRQWTQVKPTAETLPIYNRERIISCSLVESESGTVQALYSIQIIPVCDQSSIELQFYRPHSQKSCLHLPFLEPSFFSDNVDQILADDPYVVVAAADSIQNVADKKSGQGGLLVELSNDVPNQKDKVLNLLVVNDVAQKVASLPQPMSKDKSRVKQQNEGKYLQNNHFGPSTLSITLNIRGCLKIQASCELWQECELIYQLQTRLFEQTMQTNYFYILSDDEQTLKLSRTQKTKHEGHELFKRTKQNEKIKVFFSIFATQPGLTYVNLHVVEAVQLLEQESALQQHSFQELQPLYKMVLCIHSKPPTFKEVLRININRSSQQKVIEQPFSYRSTAAKKAEFRVMSSQPHLVWARQSDSAFQLESKGERKLSLYFNIEQLVRSNESVGVTEQAVVGVKWDKGIDYFSFRFNIF